ncbi:hypothetical protein EMIHUDRAFT_458076, partial [Emiliania huxleyi CCMP1516]
MSTYIDGKAKHSPTNDWDTNAAKHSPTNDWDTNAAVTVVGVVKTHNAVGGGSGTFEEASWLKTEADCKARCAGEHHCTAVEFALIGGYTRCEIHRLPVSHTFPLPGFDCFVKGSGRRQRGSAGGGAMAAVAVAVAPPPPPPTLLPPLLAPPLPQPRAGTAPLLPTPAKASAAEVAGFMLPEGQAATPAAPRLHLGCTSAALRLHLGCTSAAPRLHLGCTSAAPRLHLGCTSAAPRLHLG